MKNIVCVPDEILRDLSFDDIEVKLYQQHLLVKTDFILLKSYETNSQKIEILFELTRKWTEDQHSTFLAIIDEEYGWLTNICGDFLKKIRLEMNENVVNNVNNNNIITSTSETPCIMDRADSIIRQTTITVDAVKEAAPSFDCNICASNSCVLKQVITPEMMRYVSRNYRIIRRWTTLANSLQMTKMVPIIRSRVMMDGGDTDLAIIHLLEEWKGQRFKEATLMNLVSVLNEEEFNEVAVGLLERYAPSH